MPYSLTQRTLMLFQLIKNLSRTIFSHRPMRPSNNIHAFIDGGTATKTKSGKVRWSYQIYYRNEERERHEALCEKLMESESVFLFESYASALRKLPESERIGGPEWCQASSPAAKTYLAKLDQLFIRKPLLAIKIAAIIAATTSRHYILQKEALSRMCRWLNKEGTSQSDRIELGFIIHDAWPDDYQRQDSLQKTLLELLSKESVHNPEYVFRIAEKYRMKSGGSLGYVFAHADDLTTLLTIGQNLKSVAPEFAKAVYQIYLFNGRHQIMSFQATDEELRRVANELFELETSAPSPDTMKSGIVFNDLCKWGYSDAVWYPTVLERLYVAAGAIKDPIKAAQWHRAVAINVPAQSPLYTQAIDGFSKIANAYLNLRSDGYYEIRSFAKLLLETQQIACDANAVWGRNVSVTPNPHHPIIEIAMNAYWGLVARLRDIPSMMVLTALVVAVESAEELTANAAANRMCDIFKDMAELDVNAASSSLAELAHHEWYSNTDDSIKSRCLTLFTQLCPILESISIQAAAHARSGLTNSSNWR